MSERKVIVSKSRVTYRLAGLEDVPQMAELEKEVWGAQGANEEALTSRVTIFPEGNILAVQDRAIVGYLAFELVDDLTNLPAFTWAEITDNGILTRSHRPNGEYMYGLNMSVHHCAQAHNVSDMLILRGWNLMVSKDLRGCYLGSRIPGFRNYKKAHPETTVDDYIKLRRKDGRLRDYELNMYQKGGAQIQTVLPGYFPDPASLDYGVLCLIRNIFYNWPLHGLIARLLVKLSPLIVKWM